jgi:hypothetical protein
MRVAFKLHSRTNSARVSAQHQWHSFANRAGMPRPLQMVRACVAIGRRRPDWLAIGAVVGNASSRRLRQARQSFGFAASRGQRDVRGSNRILSSPAPARLEPAQRRTLEVGSCVVLSSLRPSWLGLASTWPGSFCTSRSPVSRRDVACDQYRTDPGCRHLRSSFKSFPPMRK